MSTDPFNVMRHVLSDHAEQFEQRARHTPTEIMRERLRGGPACAHELAMLAGVVSARVGALLAMDIHDGRVRVDRRVKPVQYVRVPNPPPGRRVRKAIDLLETLGYRVLPPVGPPRDEVAP